MIEGSSVSPRQSGRPAEHPGRGPRFGTRCRRLGSRAAIDAAIARCPVHDAVVRPVAPEVLIDMA